MSSESSSASSNSVPSVNSLAYRIPLHIVQGSVLASLVYATWHFGAVEAIALNRLGWIAGVGLVAMLCIRRTWSSQGFRLPSAMLVLLTLWIAYCCLQFAPSNPVTEHWFARTHQHATNHLQGSDVLEATSQSLGLNTNSQIATIRSQLASGTAIPEATRQATVPYVLALALALLAAIGFQTDRSRKYLLWAVILNAVAMALWGLVQRAGGGTQILPGVPIPFDCVPFGSFFYKNAGAAALLPAIVCVAVIAVLAIREKPSRNRYSASSSSNRETSIVGQLKTLQLPTLALTAVILCTGLFASLSRGAWLTMLLAVIVASMMYGLSLRDKRTWIGVTVLVALLVMMAMSAGLTGQITERAEQVSLNHISADQRWGQWVDGFSAAMSHLPSGTGLGTYGHSTLAFQSEPRGYWFHDAHNQYLEVLTETGLIGIALLFVGLFWFGRLSLTLFRTSGKTNLKHIGTRQAWGTAGIMLLICGGVHSCIDFVIKIPANLFLYSILVAAVAVTRRHRSSSRSTPRESEIQTSQLSATESLLSRLFLDRGAVWGVIALLLVCGANRFSSRQAVGDLARVNRTEIADTDDWSDEQLDEQLRRLDGAIASQPLRSDLYFRRSSLQLIHYRRSLVALARSQGQQVKYTDTKLQTVHALLLSVPEGNRVQLRQQFLATEEQTATMAGVFADVHRSLLLNPYQPQAQLRCALLAPLGNYPAESWLAKSASLANNNQDILFTNGLLAYYNGDNDLMIDQWSKSLAINHRQLQVVIDLASHKVPVIKIAQELVPTNRLDRIIDLLQRSRPAGSSDPNDPEINELAQYIRTSDRFDPFRRHATIAGLKEMLGRLDEAIDHWQKAMRFQPMDPKVRLRFAQSLRKAERYDDALDQATLGQHLFPSDKRFERLAGSIRHEITLQR